MISNERQPARYDLLAFNLVLAAIAALLMASVGSRLQVVQLLEGTEIAGLEIDLAVGVAVNLGIITASATIFFAMAGALCCVWRNYLGRVSAAAIVVGVFGWIATSIGAVLFTVTLITVPLTLAVEVGL